MITNGGDMGETTGLRFAPFKLEGPYGPLMHGTQIIKLTRKATALLWELARHADRVLPRSALFDAVWPGLVVSEDALDYQIRMLRRALGDSVHAPRFIATVHGVGFRFVAPVNPQADDHRASIPISASPELSQVLPGRSKELEQLAECFAQVQAGRRQTVFLTGPSGIGKTALAQAFNQSLGRTASDQAPPRIAAGQCLPHGGAAEALLPVLQALQDLCRAPDSADVLALLRRWAPTVLVRLRPLIDDPEYQALREATADASQAQVQRELVEFLEVLAEQRPLILWLEDLHFSDRATVETVSMLAQRRYATRLLVLCSYRPDDAGASAPWLPAIKHELVGRNQAREIALSCLDREAVQRHLQARFHGGPAAQNDYAELAAFIHERSGGHALYMVHLVEHWKENAGGAALDAAELQIPAALRELILHKLRRVSEADQAVIRAAAALGARFTAAEVAAALGADPRATAAQCQRLARHGQFLEEAGRQAPGAQHRRPVFRFAHALHRDVIRRYAPRADTARSDVPVFATGGRHANNFGHTIAAELTRQYARADRSAWPATIADMTPIPNY